MSVQVAKYKTRETIRVAGIEYLSLNNGEGCRMVVFVQGCRHFCEGCHNPDTWSFDGGFEIPIEDLAFEIRRHLDSHPLDGITLSGGDPYYQEQACTELLRMVGDCNVWIYTGFKFEEIANCELTQYADVIVDGPFIKELKCSGKMYGSSNQRIIRLKEGR